MIQALNLPKKVYFKAGCTPVALRELGEIYHCSRALLVTDPELYRAGIAAPVVDLLRKQGIRAAEFFTIGKRVSFADLRSALPKLHEFQPDVIVGVGGNNAMSAAKALLALYQDPELDLAAASADPARIPACTKARLVLIAANFSSGAQNSPFAILENDEGRNCSLKSIHLLPEISVTDADFTATLTAEQVKTCALEILSHAARAYLDPSCTEFTGGMLAVCGEGLSCRPGKAPQRGGSGGSLLRKHCGRGDTAPSLFPHGERGVHQRQRRALRRAGGAPGLRQLPGPVRRLPGPVNRINAIYGAVLIQHGAALS